MEGSDRVLKVALTLIALVLIYNFYIHSAWPGAYPRTSRVFHEPVHGSILQLIAGKGNDSLLLIKTVKLT